MGSGAGPARLFTWLDHRAALARRRILLFTWCILSFAWLAACKPAEPAPGVRLLLAPAAGRVASAAELSRCATVLARRVELLGVQGARVTSRPQAGRIELALPGERQLAEVKQAVQRPGVLGLHGVRDEDTGFLLEAASELPAGVTLELQRSLLPGERGDGGEPAYALAARSSTELLPVLAALAPLAPAGTDLLPGPSSPDAAELRRVSYLVERAATLGNELLSGATARPDPSTGESEVLLTLQPAGLPRLAELLGSPAGRRVAIVVDGQVLGELRAQERAAIGELRIALAVRTAEARALAAVLQSGPLPFPLVVLE